MTLVVLVLMLSLVFSIGAVATATEGENDWPLIKEFVPGYVCVEVTAGTAPNFPALNIVKIVPLYSTPGVDAYVISLTAKTNEGVLEALTILKGYSNVTYALPMNFVPGKVTVSMKDKNATPDFPELDIAEIRSIGGNLAIYSIRLNPETYESVIDALEILKQNPTVAAAEPNYLMSMTDPGGGGGGGGGVTPKTVNALFGRTSYAYHVGPFYTVKIFSVAELETYLIEYRGNSGIIGGPPLEIDKIKYNEDFFQDNFLIIHYTAESSASFQLELSSLTEDANTIKAVITRLDIPPNTAVLTVMAAWMLILEVDLSSVDKEVEIKDANIYRGDVNRDGKITASDATEILLHTTGAKLLTEQQQALADVNNDGRVSAADAMEILLIAAGLKEAPEQGSRD